MEVCALNPLPQTKLFTADAKNIHANMPTTRASLSIKNHLEEVNYNIPINDLTSELEILMHNNIFAFGDAMWL